MKTLKQKTLAAIALAIVLISPSAVAESPQVNDLTPMFRDHGVALDRLSVVEIGGIVVIRGRTFDRAAAEGVGRVAQQLGYQRVANLVQVLQPVDDASIRRLAERELTIHRSLDGCQFRIASHQGVVRLGGRVHHELQKDVALQLVRNLDGVREVRSELIRF